MFQLRASELRISLVDEKFDNLYYVNRRFVIPDLLRAPARRPHPQQSLSDAIVHTGGHRRRSAAVCSTESRLTLAVHRSQLARTRASLGAHARPRRQRSTQRTRRISTRHTGHRAQSTRTDGPVASRPPLLSLLSYRLARGSCLASRLQLHILALVLHTRPTRQPKHVRLAMHHSLAYDFPDLPCCMHVMSLARTLCPDSLPA